MKKINCNFAGENNGNAKLSMLDVEQIIALYATGAFTHRHLAALANISKSQVYRIIKGKSWASIATK